MIDVPGLRRRLAAAAASLPLATLPACSSTQPTTTDGGPPDAGAVSGLEQPPEPLLRPKPAGFIMSWCGDLEEALKLAGYGNPKACPKRLDAERFADAHPDRTFPDVNGHPTIRIVLDDSRSKAEDECCYDVINNPPPKDFLGRALLAADGAGGALLAAPCETGSWSHADGTLSGLPPALRVRLARAWLNDALTEHASVASFARAASELLAVGAPRHLVRATLEAGGDEVRHAQLTFALASAYAGRALGPRELAPATPRPADLATVAAAVFVEGCVGETIASLLAARAWAGCRVASVADVLGTIVADEARHAELAWATVGWALRTGGADVRDALEAVAAAEPWAAEDEPGLDGAAWTAHGRLDAQARAEVREQAWSQVISPVLSELLDEPTA